MPDSERQPSDILWSPPPARVAVSAMTKLMTDLAGAHGAPRDDDAAFHRWTVKHSDLLWRHVWDDCGIVGDPGAVVVEESDKTPGARWFPEASLNYAENLLRARRADSAAVIFRREDGQAQRLTYKDLCDQASRCAQLLKAAGVTAGDRVAAYMPNCPETVIAMLAAASLGAVFSSASPDFGRRGVLDRFGQIEPKVLIAANGYVYNGKTHSRTDTLRDIIKELPSLVKVLVVDFVDLETDISVLPHAVMWRDALGQYAPAPISFTRVPFDHPLFIMYSSGTTGAPKCIVHGHGGTLLQHLKEHRYHLDTGTGDRVFYFTTCGWMMWNWLVSALALETTIYLYDGAPTYPNVTALFDYVAEEQVTFFGTSAKFIDALKAAGARPGEAYDLSALRTIGSTGSPLSPESFSYAYSHIKSDVHLASIAGGTDIIGCVVSGNPRLPVRRGEIQGPALGMDVAVFSPDGDRLVGEAGELVCANSFPSMPVCFWNDDDGSRYHAAYFEAFPGIWTHGDWVAQTEQGGFIIYGRSDATLNPGGVRIGTSEIYRVVEEIDGVTEALVIGQDWGSDVRVILFVTLSQGISLDESKVAHIKSRIRTECSPRHVPAKVLSVSDIPRTRSGKISELAVRDVIHGRKVKNTEALANAAALDQYRSRPELQD